MGLSATRRRGLFSSVAMLLSLYIVADLVCVWPCCTEVVGIRITTSQPHSVSRSDTTTTSMSADQTPREPSEQSADDDGCFCCSHVLPGFSFAVVISRVEP